MNKMNHKSFKNNYIQEIYEYLPERSVAQGNTVGLTFPWFSYLQIYLVGQIIGLLFEPQSNLSQPQSKLVSNYLWFNGIELAEKPI